MKILSILFVISLSRGEKLDRLYLPPPGAHYAGGSSSDIEVPFETPNIYSGHNKSINTFIGFEPNGIVGVTSPTPNVQSTRKYFNGPPSTSSYSQTTSPFYDDNNQGDGFIHTLNEHEDITGDKGPYTYTNYNSDLISTSPENLLLKKLDKSDHDGAFNKYSSPGSNKVLGNVKNFGNVSPISNYQSTIGPDNYYTSKSKIVSRPQAEADRNAVIVNYENIITPDGFSYTFDTSNGIHADETGTATNGVKAQGSYSYIGDDGQLYNVTYSADENGFRPHGDHLPTPPPIPEAILKVIEQAAKDKINGIFDDGLYDENKYGHKKYDFKNNYPKILQTAQKDYGSYVQPNNNRNIFNSKDINNYDNIKGTTNLPNYGSDDNIKQDTPSPYRKSSTDSLNYEDSYLYEPNTSNNKLSSNVHEKSFESEKDQIKHANIPIVPSISDHKESKIGYEYILPQNKFEFNRNTVPQSTSEITGGKYNRPGQKLYPGKVDYNLGKEKDGYVSNTNYNFKPFNLPTTTDNQDIPKSYNQGTDTLKEKIDNYPTPDYKVDKNISNQPSEQNDFNFPYSSTTTRPIQYYSQPTEFVEPIGKPQFSTSEHIQYPYQSTEFAFDLTTGKPIFSSTRPIHYPFKYTEQAIDSTTGKPKFSITRPVQYPFQSIEQTIDPVTGKPKFSTNRPNQYRLQSTEQTIDPVTGKPKYSTTEPIHYPFQTTEQAFDVVTGKPTFSTTRPNQYPYQSNEQSIDLTTGKPKFSITRPVQYPFQSIEQTIDPVTGKPKFSTNRPNQYPLQSTEQTIDPVTGKPKFSTRGPIHYPFQSTGHTFDLTSGKPSFSLSRPIHDPFKSTEQAFDSTTGNPKYSITRPVQYPFQSTEQSIDPVTGKPTFSTTKPIYYPFQTTEQSFDVVTGKPRFSTTRPTQYPLQSTKQTIDPVTGKPKFSSTGPIHYPFQSTEQAFDAVTGKPRFSTTRPNQYPYQSNEQSIDLTTGKPSPSTERIIGEDFIGPKQPQRYDPETGYHY